MDFYFIFILSISVPFYCLDFKTFQFFPWISLPFFFFLNSCSFLIDFVFLIFTVFYFLFIFFINFYSFFFLSRFQNVQIFFMDFSFFHESRVYHMRIKRTLKVIRINTFILNLKFMTQLGYNLQTPQSFYQVHNNFLPQSFF